MQCQELLSSREISNPCLKVLAAYLQTQLVVVRKAAEPLRKLLDLPTHDWARHQKQAAAAALLPVPLFIIFHQLTAAATVFEERLEVTVAGHPPPLSFDL